MVSRGDSHTFQAAIMLIVTGGGFVLNALDRYRRKLRIEDTGTIPIKSAPQGFVELQGYAWPREGLVLNSILSNTKVVFYNIHLEQYVRQGRTSRWETVYQEQTPHGFLIADTSGVALLNIEGGECDVTRNTRLYKELNWTEQNRLQTYLVSKSITIEKSSFLSFGHTYRVTEGLIKPGSPLCITGSFRSLADKGKVLPASGLRAFLSQLKIAEQAPIWALQHPIAVGESTVSTQISQEPDCYGMVCSDFEANEKLFFADCHRRELSTRFSKYLGLKLIGGSLLLATGIVILFGSFH